MKKIIICIPFLAGLMFAQLAQGDDIDWTYAEAYLQYVDPKQGDSDSGYHLEASLGLPLGFHALARWEKAELGDLDGDLSGSNLGVGWHLGLGDTVMGFVELSYTNRELGVFDENGYTVNLGVRVSPLDRWEFGGRLGYRDLERNLAGGYGEAYALWRLWGPLGLTARAELSEEANRFGIGARLSF